ncbi:MAG: PhoH family protein [Candidatus Sumerlaeota bacterium]|nr:PhoH family protein [Candidatus Sumerlaeota bacterium]
MAKNFVLDTNVLLEDPRAFLKFADNNVVIPITVIEELDKFKRDLNTVGRNAREATRLLDKYREKGNLSRGVPLEAGGTLRVITDLGKEPPEPFPTLGKTADSLILATALMIRKREDAPCIFVTRDINLRLRADAIGLIAVNYEERGIVAIEEMYSGRADIQLPGEDLAKFLASSALDAAAYQLLPNQSILLSDSGNPENIALGRHHANWGKIFPLASEGEDLWGIRPRNVEQQFAMDLLLDDNIQIVTLAGKAGTGKTLLAIAAGMRKVMQESVYAKLVVARPIMPLGKELGFLPGQLGEKLRPWMEPVFDNLELILNGYVRQRKEDEDASRHKKFKKQRHKKPAFMDVRQMLDTGILDVQPLTYIRGRSLPRQFMIIDEAQNLTAHEVKTIVTRAGEGTKVVLTGDPYQIDNPFLDSNTNGLTILVERFKHEVLAGHISLFKGERSQLAELASDLL